MNPFDAADDTPFAHPAACCVVRVIGHGTPREAMLRDWMPQAFGSHIHIIEHQRQPLWKPRVGYDEELTA